MQVPPLSEEGLKELLNQTLVAKVATTSAKGEVRMSPTVFGVQPDGSILINTFEDSALVKNLRRDPNCSLLIDTTAPYADGVDPGVGVHYWGTATVEGPENDLPGMGKLFSRYVDGSEEKARAYGEKLVAWGKRVYVRFRPERKTTWDFRQG